MLKKSRPIRKSKLIKKIKRGFEEKKDNIYSVARVESRNRLLKAIMDETGMTYEEAVACTMEGPQKDPKWALYMRLTDADLALSLKTKKGKMDFAETLPDDEKEVFLAEMGQINVKKDMAGAVKKVMKGNTSISASDIEKELEKEMGEKEDVDRDCEYSPAHHSDNVSPTEAGHPAVGSAEAIRDRGRRR